MRNRVPPYTARCARDGLLHIVTHVEATGDARYPTTTWCDYWRQPVHDTTVPAVCWFTQCPRGAIAGGAPTCVVCVYFSLGGRQR